MGILQNKIDFVALISVHGANPNGDPLDGNRPRQEYSGLGEMSDVCIKRKIRNRMQDLGHPIFVQSEDRRSPGDHYDSLKDRADNEIGKVKKGKSRSKKSKTSDDGDGMTREAFAAKACDKYLDVRAFGQVFAFKEKKRGNQESDSDESESVSVGVRGPVSIHQAVSISPVEIESLQITKSVNGSPADDKKGTDTMGMKHFVRFGLYMVKGSINVQLAEKTGFTEEDAEVVKECLRTLFVNDASAARPDGSMEVVKLFWFKHDCKDGQCSSAKVHRSVKVTQKDPKKTPESFEDYTVALDGGLEGPEPEILEGV